MALWLTVEALFSAYLSVWFNVRIDIAVALLSFPWVRSIRSKRGRSMTVYLWRSRFVRIYEIGFPRGRVVRDNDSAPYRDRKLAKAAVRRD